MNIGFLTATGAILLLAGCKLPEQRKEYYSSGVIKERYWIYRDSGREVMDGLYTGWFPNGEREVEILYRDGSEITRNYYNERGHFLGRSELASLREP